MYCILFLHRHPLKGVRPMAHPITADTLEEAETLVVEVGTHHKAPAWIIEFDKPEIRPQLQVVKPEPYLEGDALIIEQ